MGLFASLRNAVRWAGFDLGRYDGASAQAVVMIDPATGEPVSPTNVTLTGPITVANEVEIKNDVGNPVPVSLASLPLPTGAAQDGTDGTGITAPTGGSGIRGWLSGIYSRLAKGVATSANSLSVAQASDSVFSVSGSAAAGTPPIMPPLSVSGVDGSGNKQHLRTDTSGNQGVYGAATRSTAAATIANGTSVSGSVDLTNTALLGFIAPAGWTTAALNLEVSMDNTTWATAVYDGSGSAVSSWSALAAGAGYAVDTVSMLPFRYVRFRSGTSASPVNQSAQRDFVVITRPLA